MIVEEGEYFGDEREDYVSNTLVIAIGSIGFRLIFEVGLKVST